MHQLCFFNTEKLSRKTCASYFLFMNKRTKNSRIDFDFFFAAHPPPLFAIDTPSSPHSQISCCFFEARTCASFVFQGGKRFMVLGFLVVCGKSPTLFHEYTQKPLGNVRPILCLSKRARRKPAPCLFIVRKLAPPQWSFMTVSNERGTPAPVSVALHKI